MFLLRRREWDRRIQSGDADDWRVEIVESFLVNDGGDFSSDAAGSRVFMQKNDFMEIFEVMKDLPVVIRLLDPPLHEFLPQTEEDMKDLAKKMESRPTGRLI